MRSLLEIDSLSFYYGTSSVLEDISFSVLENDFLAIIGPNGGGKSTLLKLMLGLLPIKIGSIHLKIPRCCLGYVPQNTNLNTDFPITALEVVLMGHIGSKKPFFGYSKTEVSCAERSLAQVGMSDYRDVKIGDLSGGQRQRIFIARALCGDPQVLLLDEPTASIDAEGESKIYDLLKKLNSFMSIVVVSHDMSVVLNYAKNIVHINKTMVYHHSDTIEQTIKQRNDSACQTDLVNLFTSKSRLVCNHNNVV